jgi:hypothetical protein
VLHDANNNNLTITSAVSLDTGAVVLLQGNYMNLCHPNYDVMDALQQRGHNTLCGVPGGRFISCGSDQSLNIWGTSSGSLRLLRKITTSSRPTALNFLSNGRVVVGCATGLLCIWNVEAGNLVGSIHNAHDHIVTIVDLPQSNFFATSGDGNVKIWNSRNFMYQHTIRNLGVSHLLECCNGHLGVVTRYPTSLTIYDTNCWITVAKYQLDSAHDVILISEVVEKTFLICTNTGLIIWDLTKATGNPREEGISGEVHIIPSIQFSHSPQIMIQLQNKNFMVADKGGKLVLLSVHIQKWLDFCMWLFLGSSDEGCLFYCLPVEVLYHVVTIISVPTTDELV